MGDDIATKEGLGLIGTSTDGRRSFTPTPPESVEVAAGTAANYAWWQRHGGEWVREYDERKCRQPRYHIQEMMLVDYVLRHAEALDRPLRVLEFGCGVGRHLRNLSQLPGVEAFGYDQSPTMVEGMLAWTGQDWIDQHVTLGTPTGRLPFDDDAFDIVYTSEVLVHVRPEDVSGILAELCRVSRSQVLHIEPSAAYRIVSDAHDGCWNHDLVALYAAQDRSCETLASGFFSQTPFRVIVDGAEAPYTWPPAMLGLMRRLEHDLVSGLTEVTDQRDELRERAKASRADAKELREQIKTLRDEIKALRPAAAKVGRLESEAASLRKEAKSTDGERVRAAAKLVNLEEKLADLRGKLEQSQANRDEAERRAASLREDVESLRATRDELVAERDALELRAMQMESSLKRQVHVTRDTTVHLERLNKQQREAAARLVREREAIVRRVATAWSAAEEPAAEGDAS